MHGIPRRAPSLTVANQGAIDMRLPRPLSVIRSMGNGGARANAQRALERSAANRTAVETLLERLTARPGPS